MKSSLFIILSILSISINCFAQNNFDTITDEISDTTFGIKSIYFNPIENIFFKNIYSLNCWDNKDSDSITRCVFTKEISSNNGKNIIIEYYTKDNILIASGWSS